jgi:dCTP deaminase
MQLLRRCVEEKVIGAVAPVPEGSYQPASLDLRLGEVAHRLQCSFLPGDQTVESRLREFSMEEVDLRSGAVLERNRPYLIPLAESLRLPGDISARTNPKSSTGRLDIFTRVITDKSHQFDEIKPGYKGRLYLELFSRTFTIKVRAGLSLNQLRLQSGRAEVSDRDVEAAHLHDPLVVMARRAVPMSRLAISRGIFLSVDLARAKVGYRARRNSRLLDLTRREPHEPAEFWDEVHSEPGRRLILEPEDFYLLVSREGVRIPPDLAAEMVAYDPTSGELRTHYAGFFDPGFGYDSNRKGQGSRAVLEVRAHDVPFMLEDGQRICQLAFERMIEPPERLYGRGLGSHYQGQELMLSKHFRPPIEPAPGKLV